MASISFLPKNKPDKNGYSLIMIQSRWDKKKFSYSTGHKILVSQWCKKRQRAKNGILDSTGQFYLNDILKKMEDVFISSFRQESINGTPTIEKMRFHLDEAFNKNRKPARVIPTLYELIDLYINNKISHHGKFKSESTIKSYRTTLKHLKQFEKEYNYRIDYDTINMEFYSLWLNYFRDLNIKENALYKYLGTLKAFMEHGHQCDYHTNLTYKKRTFSVRQKITDQIALTNEELMDIYNCDVSHDVKQTNIKDAFVLNCTLGLRFSDYKKLTKDNMVTIENENYIRVTTNKTSTEVLLPILDLAASILYRYRNTVTGFPKVYYNHIFNREIKQIARKAKLFETNRLPEQPKKPLWAIISSHVCRRTFCTLSYLAGASLPLIMLMSSHRKESTLQRYIRISRIKAAKTFGDYMKNHYSKVNMKVVG